MMHGLSSVKIGIYVLIGLPNYTFLKSQCHKSVQWVSPVCNWSMNLLLRKQDFRSTCFVPGIDIWSMSVALFEYMIAQWNSFGIVRKELIGANWIDTNSLNVSRTGSTEICHYVCHEVGCGYCYLTSQRSWNTC